MVEATDRVRIVFTLLGVRGMSAAAVGLGSVLAARVLGPERQGTLALLLALAILLVIVCGFGTNVVARRLLVGPDPQLLLGDYLGLAASLSVVVALLIFSVGTWLGPYVHIGKVDAVLAASFYGAMSLGTMLLLDALNADGQLIASGAIDAAGSLLQLAAVVLFALTQIVTPSLLLWAYGATLLAEVVMILAMLRRGGSGLRPAVHPARWWTLLKKSTPAATLSISQTAVYRSDRYLLGLMRSQHAVGIYSVASTGSEFLRLLPLAYGQLAFFEVTTGTATRESIYRQRRTVLAACGVLASFGLIFAPEIVVVALGKSYSSAVSPFRLLLIANIANASYLIDTALLTATGAIAGASVSTGAGLLCLVALDLILIPKFSESGAAAALLLAYCSMAILSRRSVASAFRNRA